VNAILGFETRALILSQAPFIVRDAAFGGSFRMRVPGEGRDAPLPRRIAGRDLILRSARRARLEGRGRRIDGRRLKP